MKAALVVGARPNFMKVSPLMRELRRRGKAETLLVHTGQHYDENMSKIFFQDLQLPEPDIYLGVGSGSHAEQTAKVMVAFAIIMEKQRPDLIIVVGDVNSTLSCSLVGAKMRIPVAHVEAGLRSFDLDMPEEINRMVTDILSRFCFTTSPEAEVNLKREGVGEDRIFFVGNIMIDSLLYYLEKTERSTILEELGLTPGNYILVTLHRPSNVDDPDELRALFEVLNSLATRLPVVFPVHPRTRKMIDSAVPPIVSAADFRLIEPVGYLDFIKAMRHSRMVITDSGGIQEETTVLGIPCLTVRNNTERPITVEMGTNVLVGTDPREVEREASRILQSDPGKHDVPPLWDGKTAGRIADILERYFS
ncbi:MAG: UDP-N-acetylglucosamine 2-epimerase (non-hydrolyzing) [Candidatus Krumholzibacteriota bacterium]|nr:UDP-N-acetylglucosamine 2-epimerase (non-hydrolyzing) [Candidatus Krumholzibacteriota bacterium]